MARQFVIGLGTGRCGLKSLVRLLASQPDASITHMQPPVLPWDANGDKRQLIGARLARMRGQRKQSLLGDVAPFYLPYVDEILARDSRVRFICLKRPRQATVDSFQKWLKKISPLRINHWSTAPTDGGQYDPYWSRVFPKYSHGDLKQCLGAYWDEYYARAGELEKKHAGQFRVFDVDQALNEADGVRELLEFVGIDRREQAVHAAINVSDRERPDLLLGATLKRPRGDDDPARCVVLVPHNGNIVQGCQEALMHLEKRGYVVRRVSGVSSIDQGRSMLATRAMMDGFQETLWIDSDIVFDPDEVNRLRAHRLPLVCGVYVKKGVRELACNVMPGVPSMKFGEEGGLQEILFAGMGFFLVRREVYMTIQEQKQLPVCNDGFKATPPCIPYFLPRVEKHDEGYRYYAEDFSFCLTARECGFSIYADTRVRLHHVGQYAYTWEDMARGSEQHSTFTLRFNDTMPT